MYPVFGNMLRVVTVGVLTTTLVLLTPALTYATPEQTDPVNTDNDISWDNEAAFIEHLKTANQESVDRVEAETYTALQNAVLKFRQHEALLGGFLVLVGTGLGYGALTTAKSATTVRQSVSGGCLAGSAFLFLSIGALIVFESLNGSSKIQRLSYEDFKQLITENNAAYIEKVQSLLDKIETFTTQHPVYLQIPRTLQTQSNTFSWFHNIQEAGDPLFEITQPSFFEPSEVPQNTEAPLYVVLPPELGRNLINTLILNTAMHIADKHSPMSSLQLRVSVASPYLFELRNDLPVSSSDTGYMDFYVATNPTPNDSQPLYFLRYQIRLADILYQIEYNDMLEGNGLFIPLASDTSGFRKLRN